MLSEAWQRLHVEVIIYRMHLNLNPSSYFKFDKFSFLLHSTRQSHFDFIIFFKSHFDFIFFKKSACILTEIRDLWKEIAFRLRYCSILLDFIKDCFELHSCYDCFNFVRKLPVLSPVLFLCLAYSKFLVLNQGAMLDGSLESMTLLQGCFTPLCTIPLFINRGSISL